MRTEIHFAIPYTFPLGTQVIGDLNLENDNLIDQEAFLFLFLVQPPMMVFSPSTYLVGGSAISNG